MDKQYGDLERRVTELEICLAHQQRLGEQLGEVVTDQTRTLLRFETLIPKLQQQLKDLRSARKGDPDDPLDERPPHY